MNEQLVPRSADPKCTPVRDCVNQCFHEGCQWKDQWATIQRLQARVKYLEETMIRTGQTVAKAMSEMVS